MSTASATITRIMYMIVFIIFYYITNMLYNKFVMLSTKLQGAESGNISPSKELTGMVKRYAINVDNIFT